MGSIGDAFKSVLSILGPVGSIVGAIAPFFGGSDQKKLPAPQAPPKPEGKATKPDIMDFSGLKTQNLETPKGLSFSAGSTPQQQRSQIATQGVAGGTGQAGDPSIQEYYKNLAINTLTGPGGQATGDVLPVERQYARDVLGQTPRNESTASFLSALLRA